ncbi:alpha/beta fold hydrolase [Mesobacterium sp. TK19101]|uniref:Alpha/beta fold hydrolase n=1 Tax=Mesobacterium hydrothermale TaxID=3111907 RepID=A0ABU6HH75_9RHOB|nr:alpha/beta fold hydrolase [Mesobacterium sp. TK19101]MEC3861810.1 alpha/beta fold hydrolase [Mesobacterium sp. TK19101]
MKDFDKQHMKIAEISSFFAGGKRVTLTDQPQKHVQVARNGPARLVDLNGDYVTRQCYVQHVRLAASDYETPVMFWHGGAMTGVTWETTPDGRPGWQMRFLQAGFDTYVCDAVERGRSGWSPFPEIYDTAPIFRTSNEAWELFRFGAPDGYSNNPNECRPHQGSLFPISALDHFSAQFVPRWTTHGQETLEAYFDVLKRTGPVWLIAHSQGGNFALDAAARHPEFFKGVVVIEPASAPEDIGAAKLVPHLFVWGDYIEHSPTWVSYRERADAYATALANAGGFVETLDLPANGIPGNSHVPMMDVNSDHVADLVQGWIDRIR